VQFSVFGATAEASDHNTKLTLFRAVRSRRYPDVLLHIRQRRTADQSRLLRRCWVPPRHPIQPPAPSTTTCRLLCFCPPLLWLVSCRSKLLPVPVNFFLEFPHWFHFQFYIVHIVNRLLQLMKLRYDTPHKCASYHVCGTLNRFSNKSAARRPNRMSSTEVCIVRNTLKITGTGMHKSPLQQKLYNL